MDVVNAPAAAAQMGCGIPNAVGSVECEVQRLIAASKCKQAVELAKDEHKRRHTPESERLVVEAYLSRIEQFQKKGAAEDAQTLLKLVRERFPAHRGRLAQLELRSAAIEGNLDALVAPLAHASISEEIRNSIEAMVRQKVVDLSGLANCRSLPAEHPLKVEAAAAWRAFEAATAGPVTDEQIALPEISRRSPLAGWKMLLRAIAAFYRNDDAACRRALEGIPEDAAARGLAPVLLAMIEGRPAGGGAAGVLQVRIGGDDRPLREALANLDKELVGSDLFAVKKWIGQAVQTCGCVYPELCERLRQHLSVRCAMEEVPVHHVLRIMGPALRSAYYWRLLARGMERRGDWTGAALYWERFLCHAVREKMVLPASKEAAAVWLHAAGIAARLMPEELEEERRHRGRGSLFKSYYHGQPPEIAALAPRSDREVVETALNPGLLFARAAEIDPQADTFKHWWAWVMKVGLPDRAQEEVAQIWRQKRPGDPLPLLLLSVFAEERDALKLALKYLAEAEAIDAINPQVRKARLRLTLATTWRHLKDRRPHLVEKDLAALEALPAMAEADRPAFLCALRVAWHVLRGEKAEAQHAYEGVVSRLGPLAAAVVMNSVGERMRLGRSADWPAVTGVALPDPHAVADAEARTIRLAYDLQLRMMRPTSWDSMINDVLLENPFRLSQADVLAIGRAAASRGDFQMAYLASAAGLSTANGPAAARFLLLRARSVESWSPRRVSQCLRAAMELAQQTHDAELMGEVSAEIDRHPTVRRRLSARGAAQRLGEELLADILKSERDARSVPRDAAQAERYVVAIENDSPVARFHDDGEPDSAYEEGFEEDEEYEEYEEDAEDVEPSSHGMLPDGIPIEALPLLNTLIEKFGRVPSPQELIRTDPMLAMRLLGVLHGVKMNPKIMQNMLDAMDDDSDGSGGRRGGRGKRRY